MLSLGWKLNVLLSLLKCTGDAFIQRKADLEGSDEENNNINDKKPRTTKK